MKKRLIITEEEKSRILGLHKSLMMEQPLLDPEQYEKNMKFGCVVNHPYMTQQTKTGGKTEYIWGNLYFKLDGTYYVEGNPENLLTYSCDQNVVVTQNHGRIKPSMNQIITPNSEQGVANPEQAKTEEKKENIVTNFDRKYNYKKEGDKYFYQLKSTPDKWIEATNPSTKSAIGVQVFKDKGACIFPKDPCPSYDGKEWEDSNNTEQDKKEKNIGFCTTNYCSAKYVQDTLNAIITDEGRKGHEKLKGQKPITVDGKFGTQTQNLVYKLLSKLTATPSEVENMWKED